jgi:hypothetical protein
MAHDILRKVKLQGRKGDYVLTTWDTHRRDQWGKYILGYSLTGPHGKGKRSTKPIFTGEDYHVGAGQAIDSDSAIRALIGFLAIQPGDTDDEYFDKYTKRQLRFAKEEGEELSMYAMEDADDPYPLEDVGGRAGGKKRHGQPSFAKQARELHGLLK